jgi:hypothetical protein
MRNKNQLLCLFYNDMHSVVGPIAASSSSVLASEFALHWEPNLYLCPAEWLLQVYSAGSVGSVIAANIPSGTGPMPL